MPELLDDRRRQLPVHRRPALSADPGADPRNPDFYKAPLRARALGAHQNGIETFPLFAAAVLLAEFRTAPQDWIDTLAGLFILIRLAYVFAYISDRSTLRSILWGVGFAAKTALFFLPAFKR
jgi:uncharacterized MAPEG superfamily protein